METISKLRLRLRSAIRQNDKWRHEMAKMPEKIRIVGRTPVVDEHDIPSGLQVVPMSKLHVHVGSYYGKIVKILKAEGIIAKENGMWRLRDDLQEDGLAVYVTGRMRCYYRFYLSWTPQGIAFIKDIINNRTRK